MERSMLILLYSLGDVETQNNFFELIKMVK